MAGPLSDLSDEHLQLLHGHFERNKVVLEAIEGELGNLNGKFRLDFDFDCPTPEAAEELRAFLYNETDYDLRVEGPEVSGTTQETEISLQIVQQWTYWMFRAGLEHGNCILDGWGTSLPK